MEWNLNNYYKGYDEKYKSDVELLKSYSSIFNNILGDFDNVDTTKLYLDYVTNTCNYNNLVSNLVGFNSLKLATNCNDLDAQKNKEMIVSCINENVEIVKTINTRFAKVNGFLELVSTDSNLAEFKFIAEELVHNEFHSLDPKTEYVMSKYKENGSTAWASLRSKLISNHKVSVDNKEYTLTEALTLAYTGDSKSRKLAYESEIASYKSIENELASCLNAIKGETIVESKLRGYKDPLDMVVSTTRINSKVLDSLIKSIENSLSYFEKYFLLKANILGYKQLPWYEMYAPIVDDNSDVPFEKGKEIVLSAFKEYSEELYLFAKNAFESNWIDVYPREGKISGAFCSSNPSINESRILLNYGNSIGDVVTLAHELGHGFHSYCMNNEETVNRAYPMTLAETASNFCEILVKKYIYNTGDTKIKKVILETEISDLAQVIVDIYSRFTFEKSLFEKRELGTLSSEEICDLMYSAQKNAYGNGMDPNYLHPYMWTWKPHYYSVNAPYYNFPYAFGSLFSKGLYNLYVDDSESFKTNYKDMLAKTGKMKVSDVTASMGINIETEEFWTSVLETVNDDIQELELLMKNL